MEKNPSWFRARIAAIRKLIDELPTDRGEKNPDRTLIRNGFIPDKLKNRFESLHEFEYKLTFALNEPLSFTEQTSFNTWFAMHPEKICGKEVSTSSREFPITVKGSKEEIISTIKAGIEESAKHTTKSDFEKHIEENVPEEELEENRFGKPEDILQISLADFHSLYYDNLEKFEAEHKSRIQKIEQLKEELKTVGQDKKKKKELTEKLNSLSSEQNRDRVFFEDDWMKFWVALKEMIRQRAIKYGFYESDIDEYDITNLILTAMTDRPWTETYWDWRVNEVINKELSSLTFRRKFKGEHEDKIKAENLELEALALETELLLLLLSDCAMKRSPQ